MHGEDPEPLTSLSDPFLLGEEVQFEPELINLMAIKFYLQIPHCLFVCMHLFNFSCSIHIFINLKSLYVTSSIRFPCKLQNEKLYNATCNTHVKMAKPPPQSCGGGSATKMVEGVAEPPLQGIGDALSTHESGYRC